METYIKDNKIEGELIAFWDLCSDESPLNPMEDWDGFGKFVSFNSRHITFQHPNDIEQDEDMVLLSYFEHGNCLWGVKGTMNGMPDFRWDGTDTAGVWYPDDCLRKEADMEGLKKGTPERAKRMEEFAAQACETWTQYCNGEVYGYSVRIYKLLKLEDGSPVDAIGVYEDESALFQDSCYGFFGREYAEQEMEGLVEDSLKKITPPDFSTEMDD